MKLALIILITGFALNVIAQFKLQWYGIYDYPHPSYNDDAADLVEDDLGNIYITGRSSNWGLSDDWRYDLATIKYNSEGDSLWVKRYNSNSEDQAIGIGIDGQRNIYVAGNSFQSAIKGTLIKYDSDGNEIWVRSYYDSNITVSLRLNDMLVDTDGNIYLSFSFQVPSKISEIVKYNSNGDLIWVAKYFKSDYDRNNLLSITLDNSGNIFAAGVAIDSGKTEWDYLVLKYDPQGNLLWESRKDFTSDDIGYSIKTDNSGNAYLAGYSYADSNNYVYDMKLLKYNSSGEEQWVRSYTGRKDADGFKKYYKKNMITIDESGYVYLNFTSYQSVSKNNIATGKYNPAGDLLWMNIYRIDSLDSYEEAIDIKLDKHNNVYTCGCKELYLNEQNSFVILKYDNNGGLQKIINNDGLFTQSFHPVAISLNKKGDVTATGSSLTLSNPQITDYFTVKYSISTGIQSNSNSLPPTYTLYQNYPNPFNPSTNLGFGISSAAGGLGFVSLKVYDVLGNEVATLVNESKPAGSYNYQFSTDNYQLTSGIYFYRLEVDGNLIDTKRMVLLK